MHEGGSPSVQLMAIGSHEFDFGPDVFADFIELLANPSDLLLPGDEPNIFSSYPLELQLSHILVVQGRRP